MEKKVAIVTGGVAGIGKAITLGLAAEGYLVVVCDVNDERGNALAEEYSGSVVYRNCDVSDEESVKDVVDKVSAEYGRIDVLVNNAGIIRRRTGEEISTADWDLVFKVNVRGAFLFCKHAAEVMKKAGKGRIINVSSVAAKLGDITSAPGYGPSKAAMDGLTKTFARELAAQGITVNGVAPHAIETDMSAEWSPERRAAIIDAIPMKTLGQPEDVAAAVLFLASEGAKFITGEIIDVNGGFLMD